VLLQLLDRRDAARNSRGPRRKQEQPMDKQEWINLLVSWVRFLFLILVWIGVAWMLRLRGRVPPGRTIAEIYELQLEEMKRHTATIDRIAQALENRGRS
jgi:hypothetical protein